MSFDIPIILICGVLIGVLYNSEVYGILGAIPQYLGSAGIDGRAISRAAQSAIEEL
jgi:hypothetical protein